MLFYVFGAIAIGASMLVVGQRNLLYSVLLLTVSFGALAGLYVLLDSPFAAVVQIIVYAGAIMVVFLFVIMLLNVPREEPAPGVAGTFAGGARPVGIVLVGLLALELAWALSTIVQVAFTNQVDAVATVSSVRAIGRALFTRFGVAVQATAILTLVAMIGAVMLAKKRSDERGR